MMTVTVDAEAGLTPAEVFVSQELAEDLVAEATVDFDDALDAVRKSHLIAPFSSPELHDDPLAFVGALMVGTAGTLASVQCIRRTAGKGSGWSITRPWSTNTDRGAVGQVVVARMAKELFAYACVMEGGVSAVRVSSSADDGATWSEWRGSVEALGRAPLRVAAGRDATDPIVCVTRADGLALCKGDSMGYGGVIRLTGLTDEYCVTEVPAPSSAGAGGRWFLFAVRLEASKLQAFMVELREDPAPVAARIADSETDHALATQGSLHAVVRPYGAPEGRSWVDLLYTSEHRQLHSVRYSYATQTGQGGAFAAPERFPGGLVADLVVRAPTEETFFCVDSTDDSSRLWVLETSGKGWTLPTAMSRDCEVVAAVPGYMGCLFCRRDGEMWNEYFTGKEWVTLSVIAESDDPSVKVRVRETARHRVTITVCNAAGVPVLGAAVYLKVDSDDSEAAYECFVNGKSTWLTSSPPSSPVGVSDYSGKMTLVFPPDGLAAPDLVFQVAGIQETYHIYGAEPALDYLAGLDSDYNPTDHKRTYPTFDEDGEALKEAKLPDGTPLLPPTTSRHTLRETAQTILALTAPADESSAAGFLITRAPDGPRFTRLDTPHAVESARAAALIPVPPEHRDDNSWAAGIIGSIWSGFKTGAIMVDSLLWNAGKKTWDLLFKLGDATVRHLTFGVFDGKQVCALLAQVFEWVGATVDKVVDWLKAIFDWAAIRNTQKALLSAMDRSFTFANAAHEILTQHTADAFDYMKKETRQAFTALKGDPEWDRKIKYNIPPELPDHREEYPEGVATSAHTNWAHEKIPLSKIPNQNAPTPTVPEELTSAMTPAVEDELVKQYTGVSGGAGGMFDNKEDFQSSTMRSLLELIENIAVSSINAGKAVATAALNGLQAVLDGIREFLTGKLELPQPIKAMWDWLMGTENAPCTPAAILAMTLAFPVTIGYKLVVTITGQPASSEPFPGGTLPSTRADDTHDIIGMVAGIVRNSCALWMPMSEILGTGGEAAEKLLSITASCTALAVLLDLILTYFADYGVYAPDLSIIPDDGRKLFIIGVLGALIALYARFTLHMTAGKPGATAVNKIACLLSGITAAALIAGNTVALFKTASDDLPGTLLCLAGLFMAVPDLFALGQISGGDTATLVKAAVAFICPIVAGLITSKAYQRRGGINPPTPAKPVLGWVAISEYGGKPRLSMSVKGLFGSMVQIKLGGFWKDVDRLDEKWWDIVSYDIVNAPPQPVQARLSFRGNVSEIGERDFTVDKPTVTFPVAGSTVETQKPTFTGRRITKATVTLHHGSSQTEAPAGEPTYAVAPSSNLPLGQNTVHVTQTIYGVTSEKQPHTVNIVPTPPTPKPRRRQWGPNGGLYGGMA
ncbi:hypothetical protein H9Y04_45275 [Streptomyces sp. TRM66268-LWL]|uniref:Uncharacterized protein n=1 Tax=Streptomyces polyasparticus TaxID=2767826 RepID=A0ABR7SW08_9ACTN|nr:hypothetical protein [Streptomyces polyasparticus]MBC9719692.1 hypothetical protein [Streptomyces polyasparticus]